MFTTKRSYPNGCNVSPRAYKGRNPRSTSSLSGYAQMATGAGNQSLVIRIENLAWMTRQRAVGQWGRGVGLPDGLYVFSGFFELVEGSGTKCTCL